MNFLLLRNFFSHLHKKRMTCVFDALVAGLRGLDPTILNPWTLVARLKADNTPPSDVLWNGSPLSPSEVSENVRAIANELRVGDGHLTGACDYMIVACCHVFRVNVDHRMLQNTMSYRVPGARRTIIIESSARHMSFVSAV